LNAFRAPQCNSYFGRLWINRNLPAISFNDLNNKDFEGTVGKVIEHVEVKIAEAGEILCGSNVMLGYYKDEKINQ
jgi:long-subunit acyl-CoA synthetase (AMP-forming)